jgi:hypothetical protein
VLISLGGVATTSFWIGAAIGDPQVPQNLPVPVKGVPQFPQNVGMQLSPR